MYQSILVPLDGSEHATKAIGEALRLAEAGSKLTLLRITHTVDDLMGVRQPDLLDNTEKSDDVLAREAYEDEVREAQLQLEASKTALGSRAFEIGVEIASGPPVDTILRVGENVGADIIVITSFGLSASSTPSKSGMFGRVADGVIKNSKIPVLVVKPWD